MGSIQVISFIFPLWYFNNNLFCIPIKLISRQDHTWSSIPTSYGTLSALFTRSADQSVSMIDHPHFVVIFDLTILYLKCCRTINKQFVSVDSFPDWEGHHWVFILLQPNSLARSLQITAPELLLKILIHFSLSNQSPILIIWTLS